jgi:uncharacterized membrane protein YqjE
MESRQERAPDSNSEAKPDLHSDSHTDPHPGLIAGLTAVIKNIFGLALNRIELAALEISEARANLLKLLLVFACGIVAVWFAFVYWSVLVVFLAWDALGWKILLIMAIVFTLLAIGIFLYARSMLKKGKLAMPVTMAELRRDRDALL